MQIVAVLMDEKITIEPVCIFVIVSINAEYLARYISVLVMILNSMDYRQLDGSLVYFHDA